MAMKDLYTLIRLRKWEVDERQRALATLLRREEAVLAAQRALAEEIAQEKAFGGRAEVLETFTFSAYLDRCEERRLEMENALDEVRKLIEEARDQLAEAYRRLKTFEVTQEQREDAEEKEFNRR